MKGMARISLPAKSAMQSGRSGAQKWLLEFMPSEKEGKDLLMGWVSSGDTKRQVQLEFSSKEEAVAYARRAGLTFEIEEPRLHRNNKSKAYADNFRFDRKANWTH